MIYSYYPGCTLKTKAKELDIYARKSAEVLGLVLEELPEWQCCGAVYPMAQDEIATKLSSVRALISARALGGNLVTMCSACHHVLKRVNRDMDVNSDMQLKVNNYLGLDTPYKGETKVIHYLELIRDVIGFDKLKKSVVKPLKGMKIAAYYGCLLLRPSDAMQFDNAENPSIIEDFISAIGAEPVIYPYRNECCGAYMALSEKGIVKEKCKNIIESACEKGADTIVTACPLCMYNLDSNVEEERLRVRYFTGLLAEALGAL